jgi:hypothetical protein
VLHFGVPFLLGFGSDDLHGFLVMVQVDDQLPNAPPFMPSALATPSA